MLLLAIQLFYALYLAAHFEITELQGKSQIQIDKSLIPITKRSLDINQRKYNLPNWPTKAIQCSLCLKMLFDMINFHLGNVICIRRLGIKYLFITVDFLHFKMNIIVSTHSITKLRVKICIIIPSMTWIYQACIHSINIDCLPHESHYNGYCGIWGNRYA